MVQPQALRSLLLVHPHVPLISRPIASNEENEHTGDEHIGAVVYDPAVYVQWWVRSGKAAEGTLHCEG